MKRLVLTVALIAAGLAPALAQAGKLAVNNGTGSPIHQIFVSPIDLDQYGPDLLKGTVVKAGESFPLTGLQNGLYDMKVVDDKGQSCILNDVDFFQFSIWTLGPNCTGFGGTGE
jgi:hypothetical protein